MTHLFQFVDPARRSASLARAALLLGLLFLALISGACTRGGTREASAEAAIQPSEVRVIQPELKSIEIAISITGSLVSTVQVDVRTEVPGRLVQAAPREGEFVTQGQVLARLDDSNYRLSEQQARAGVVVAEAVVERARTAVEHADREMERARQVQASGGITLKDFQASEFTARDARAQLQLAQAQAQQARETLAIAEKKARDCVILAPISAIVQTRNVNEGIYLDLKEIVARLVDNSQLEMEATVPSAELGRLQPGQRVRFTVHSFPGHNFSGDVVRLAPAMIEASRSIRVRIHVPNPDGRLKAGMFARGEIVTGRRPNAVVLPASAVLRSAADPNRASVVAVENGVVHKREIELGADQDGRVEVLRGLRLSETVLADPTMAPADGNPVKAKKN